MKILGIFQFYALIILFNFPLYGSVIEDLRLDEQKILYLQLEELDNLRSLTKQKDNFPNKFICISLGKNCEVAYHIQRANLCNGFFPFDWMRSSNFDLVIKLIEDKFENFLNKDLLNIISKMGKHHVVSNEDFALEFVHDFDKNKNIANGFTEVKEKYDRRIARFYNALQTKKHIYFFRRSIIKEQAVRFCLMMKKFFAKTKYTLVAIDERIECNEPWNLENVVNFHYTRSVQEGWKGNVEIWDYIFKRLGLSENK